MNKSCNLLFGPPYRLPLAAYGLQGRIQKFAKGGPATPCPFPSPSLPLPLSLPSPFSFHQKCSVMPRMHKVCLRSQNLTPALGLQAVPLVLFSMRWLITGLGYQRSRVEIIIVTITTINLQLARDRTLQQLLTNTNYGTRTFYEY